MHNNRNGHHSGASPSSFSSQQHQNYPNNSNASNSSNNTYNSPHQHNPPGYSHPPNAVNAPLAPQGAMVYTVFFTTYETRPEETTVRGIYNDLREANTAARLFALFHNEYYIDGTLDGFSFIDFKENLALENLKMKQEKAKEAVANGKSLETLEGEYGGKTMHELDEEADRSNQKLRDEVGDDMLLETAYLWDLERPGDDSRKYPYFRIKERTRSNGCLEIMISASRGGRMLHHARVEAHRIFGRHIGMMDTDTLRIRCMGANNQGEEMLGGMLSGQPLDDDEETSQAMEELRSTLNGSSGSIHSGG